MQFLYDTTNNGPTFIKRLSNNRTILPLHLTRLILSLVGNGIMFAFSGMTLVVEIININQVIIGLYNGGRGDGRRRIVQGNHYDGNLVATYTRINKVPCPIF